MFISHKDFFTSFLSEAEQKDPSDLVNQDLSFLFAFPVHSQCFQYYRINS